MKIVLRGTGATVTERAGWLINCTGPRLRLFDDPPALVRDLARQGLARPDGHGIGLDTAADGGLLDTAGNPSTRLFALGALRRGTLWESTAIPELRAQAEALAAGLPVGRVAAREARSPASFEPPAAPEAALRPDPGDRSHAIAGAFAATSVRLRRMRISAKEDYAVRAALELAIADGGPLKREQISQAQEIPIAFLQNILMELRHAELVEAQRGRDGGFRLARPASQITVADIVRAVSGPLATVRGVRPTAVDYQESAEPLREVWVAVRTNIRAILERVTLADLAANRLPPPVKRITANHANWE